jgi:hypothetical protein
MEIGSTYSFFNEETGFHYILERRIPCTSFVIYEFVTGYKAINKLSRSFTEYLEIDNDKWIYQKIR